AAQVHGNGRAIAAGAAVAARADEVALASRAAASARCARCQRFALERVAGVAAAYALRDQGGGPFALRFDGAVVGQGNGAACAGPAAIAPTEIAGPAPPARAAHRLGKYPDAVLAIGFDGAWVRGLHAAAAAAFRAGLAP